MLRRTPFKNKYSSLKRTPFKRKTSLQPSPFFSLKKSSFKKFKPMTKKQELDNLVSKCIRLGSADEYGMVICVTCLGSFHWKIIQCGHFQKRANTSTRYDIKNLGPQCENCNCLNDGENEKFAKSIDLFYGEGTAEMLKIQARKIERYFPYDQEIEKWKQVYKKLVEERENIINY